MLGRAVGGRSGSLVGSLAGSLAGSVLGGKAAGGGGSLLNGLEELMSGANQGGAQKSATPQGAALRATPNLDVPQAAPAVAAKSADAGIQGLDDTQAEVLIRAMLNSAKSDGQADQAEFDRIVSELGQLDSEEREYLRNEMTAPFVEPSVMAGAVPTTLAPHAYAVSVMAIDVDKIAEKRYLLDFAGQLGLDENQVDQIHAELGIVV
ncbi:MAG: tellurite resistance TerB family protein [Acidimicrobiia bacterium]|nr:tellurite resistance TerB family protein [Acidimicrobiia bacterium]